jgi:AraC-like DNA-binding protein
VDRRHTSRASLFTHAGDHGLLQAVFALRGFSAIKQGYREAILRPGQWCLCDASTQHLADIGAPAEFLVAIVPQSRLTTGRLDAARHVLRPRTTACGVDRLLLDALLSAMDKMGVIAPHAATELGACLVEMMRVALFGEAQLRGLATSREALLERIDTFVRQHLRNPELSIDLIAANLRCTKRNLHKVFSDRRETLSHYIRRLRLERCAADLANPELAGQSITELSYRWGFCNSAYFSRTFKERFGVPPRSYRDPPNSLLPARRDVRHDGRSPQLGALAPINAVYYDVPGTVHQPGMRIRF